jgi:hypothetical protein
MYAPCSPDKGEAPPIELMEHWSPSADTLRGTVPEPPFFALCSWMGTEASGRFSLNGFWSIGLGVDAPVPVSMPWSRETVRDIAGLRAYQDGDSDSWLSSACWSVIEGQLDEPGQ